MSLRSICTRALFPAALLVLLAATPATAAPEPEILTPDNQDAVVEHTAVTVAGHGCPPGSEVTISLNDQPLGTTGAAANGAFTATVQMPEFTIPGDVAEGGEGSLAITCGGLRTAVLVVMKDTNPPAPQLAVDEPAAGAEVREGTMLAVAGRGCRYGQPVTVTLGQSVTAQGVTEAGGTWQTGFRVPGVDRDTRMTLSASCEETVEQLAVTVLDTGDAYPGGGTDPGDGADPGGEPDREPAPEDDPDDRDDPVSSADEHETPVAATPSTRAVPVAEATPAAGDDTLTLGEPKDGGESVALLLIGGVVVAAAVTGGMGWRFLRRQPTEEVDE